MSLAFTFNKKKTYMYASFGFFVKPYMLSLSQHGNAYINALLNSCGGIIKVGVGYDGFVRGIDCTRNVEDNIKLTVDNIAKYFQPKVSPALFRYGTYFKKN